jgi:hypothetical protein
MAKHSPPRWIDPTGDDLEVYYTYDQIRAIAAAAALPPDVCVLPFALAQGLNSAACYYATLAQVNADSRSDEARRYYVARLLAGIYHRLSGNQASANPSLRKNGDSIVDGPFVRFVQAAMEPLGQTISGNTVRDLLRNKKPSKKSTQGEIGN